MKNSRIDCVPISETFFEESYSQILLFHPQKII